MSKVHLNNKDLLMIEAFKRFKELESLDYKPFEYQLKMHRTDSSMVFMQMPNQVGKSMAACMEVVYWLRGYHPYKKLRKTTDLTIWICSDTLGAVIEALWEKKISKILPEKEYKRIIEVGQFVGVQHKITKNKLMFKAYAKGYTRLQSVPVDLVVIDEMPPYQVFMELLQRTRVTKGQIYMTFTPLRPDPQLKNLIYNPEAGVEIIRATAYDCPLYSEEDIEKAKRLLPEREFRVRWLGEWASYEGSLLPSFSERHIIEDFSIPSNWNKILCVDPASSGYVGMALIAVNPETKVAYLIKESMPKGTSPSDSIIRAEEFAKGYHVDLRASDIHETWFIKEALTKNIHYIGVRKKTNEEMVVDLDTAFANDSLYVFKSCSEAQRQFSGYANKDGAHKFDPVRGEYHILDAVKYGIMIRKNLKERLVEDARHEHSYLWDEIRKQERLAGKVKRIFTKSL